MSRGILLFADRLPPQIGGMEIHAKYFIEYFTEHPFFPLLATITKNSENRDILLWNGTKQFIDFEMLPHKFKPKFIVFNSGCWIEEMDRLREVFPKEVFIYRTGGNEILKAPLIRNKIPDHFLRQKYWKESLNRTIDLIITNSAFTESRMQKLGLITPFARCVGGVNIDALKYPKKDHRDFITIFCAARFVPYKNHLFLLAVFHQLYVKGFNIILRLAGEGPCLDQAKKYTCDLGLCSVVNFLGALDNEKVCQEIAQADIYMQFSTDYLTEVPGGSYIHSECMGRSILEALSAGTFVIACKSGALAEIVTRDRGLLVDHDNPVVVAKQIESIFSSLPERSAFYEDYSWTKLFKRYEEIFST